MGDIGAKYGFNTKENGYIKFTNYKVSKNALLGKYFEMNKKGDIQKKGSLKVMYSAMM